MSIISAFDLFKNALQAEGITSNVKIFLESDAYDKLGFELSQIQRIYDSSPKGMDFGIELLNQFNIKHISAYTSLEKELKRQLEKSSRLRDKLILLFEDCEHS